MCPGLNVVIREIVMCLYYNYGVTEIYGAPYGYLGIYSREWKKLIPDEIKYIHQSGGTYIGTSRGGFDLDKIMKAIIDNGIN